jgi:hypothetical protein
MPPSKLDVDHEVRVLLTPTPLAEKEDGDDLYDVKIAVCSTDHQIDKIVLWSGNGRLRTWVKHGDIRDRAANLPIFELTLPPADGEPGGAKPDPPKVTGWQVGVGEKVGKRHFPLLVDVYEEGDESESADGHRHGWFGEDGRPVSTPKHEADAKKAGAPDLDGWYGLWPGVGTELGDDGLMPDPGRPTDRP